MYPSLYLEKLNNAKLPELRQICKELGLKSGGLKQDVITRIYNAFKVEYTNYHAIMPDHYNNSNFDIGTALIYSCEPEVLTFGDNKKYYYIRIRIATHYINGEYRNKFYMDIHCNRKKQAQDTLDNIILATVDVNNKVVVFEKNKDTIPIEVLE